MRECPNCHVSMRIGTIRQINNNKLYTYRCPLCGHSSLEDDLQQEYEIDCQSVSCSMDAAVKY